MTGPARLHSAHETTARPGTDPSSRTGSGARPGSLAENIDQLGMCLPAPPLPSARVTLCRLHAGSAELARRISRRGQGLSWPQPGDPLIGQPEADLQLAAAEAAAEAEALERSGLGDLRIDTDGRTVAEVADLVLQRW